MVETAETAERVECDICGKSVKRTGLAQHKRLAHPDNEEGPVPTEAQASPTIEELQEVIKERVNQVAELTAKLQDAKPVGKSVEDIARILYEDVAKAICDTHGIDLQEWGQFDPVDYLRVARKIKG